MYRLTLALVVSLACFNSVRAGQWQPLSADGIHDKDNPALEVLQNPADALSRLPADSAGNKVEAPLAGP